MAKGMQKGLEKLVTELEVFYQDVNSTLYGEQSPEPQPAASKVTISLELGVKATDKIAQKRKNEVQNLFRNNVLKVYLEQEHKFIQVLLKEKGFKAPESKNNGHTEITVKSSISGSFLEIHESKLKRNIQSQDTLLTRSKTLLQKVNQALAKSAFSVEKSKQLWAFKDKCTGGAYQPLKAQKGLTQLFLFLHDVKKQMINSANLFLGVPNNKVKAINTFESNLAELMERMQPSDAVNCLAKLSLTLQQLPIDSTTGLLTSVPGPVLLDAELDNQLNRMIGTLVKDITKYRGGKGYGKTKTLALLTNALKQLGCAPSTNEASYSHAASIMRKQGDQSITICAEHAR